MTLASRRNKAKQAAAAAPTTAKAEPAKVEKKAKKGKGVLVDGPLRSIRLGRAYLENTPVLAETGGPRAQTYFDPAGHFSAAIGKDVDKARVVNSSTFIKHYNATVVKAVFGVPLRQKFARMLVEGLADQVLALVEKDFKVKIPNLASFQKVRRAARKARNPRTGDSVQVGARWTMQTKPSRAAKVYLDTND